MKRESPAGISPGISLPPMPHRKKKTRVLPNLSDCHCCKQRFNTTNPKNRLKTLSSRWRIVLLCKSCHDLVQSSKICSYCLTEISNSSMDCFHECKKCRRRVHRDCGSMFEFGLFNAGDFSVCFDCWLPNIVENEYNLVRSQRAKRKSKICGDLNGLKSSRDCGTQDKENNKEKKSLEEIVNDANIVAQKKVSVANEAKEKALGKAIVAKKAVELASGALSFVANDSGGDGGGGSMVDDDALLAMKLHRVMNSSPRIWRNLCVLNTNCMDVPKEEDGVNMDPLQFGGEKKPNGSCKSTLFEGDTNNGDVTTKLDCVQNSGEAEFEKCNGGSSDCWITYSRRGRGKELVQVKEEPDCWITYSRRPLHVERFNGERGHCFNTYSRRPSAMSPCKSLVMYNLEHGILSPDINLTSTMETRAFTNVS